MAEKSISVNNPLTVVGIFAALAEVAGTIALGTVDKAIQATFVWFVMGFPVLLLVFFFLTLNFNPKVLYAPSDFRDERYFLSTLSGTYITAAGGRFRVTEDNVEEVASAALESMGPVAASPQDATDLPALREAATSFYRSLTAYLHGLHKNGDLAYVEFRMESPEFYVVSFEIAAERLPPYGVGRFYLIVKASSLGPNQVSLEAIGRNIQADDPRIFAARIRDEIQKIVRLQTAAA